MAGRNRTLNRLHARGGIRGTAGWVWGFQA